jgi:probable F420-dependent oxidoreductase
MRIGAIYPQIELGGDPAALDAIGRASEALSYDHFLMFDHVLGASREGRPGFRAPYSNADPFHDPLTAFAYLAGVTRRIGFATGVLVLPQRQTALVARQAADVDLLSGGRLRLGVGVGWNPVEYEALGQPFARRGARLDEQIPLLRRLWTGEPLDFTGAFDRIDRAALNPAPRQAIPIWCGGGSEAAFGRAARLADGFVFSGPFAEHILPSWERLKTLLHEEGRDLAAFGAEYLVSDAMDVAATREVADRWAEAGGTHLGIRTMGFGFTRAEQHIEHLAAVHASLSAAGYQSQSL